MESETASTLFEPYPLGDLDESQVQYFSIRDYTHKVKVFESNTGWTMSTFFGHKYFSVEKSRDPDSRRHAPSFEFNPTQLEKRR